MPLDDTTPRTLPALPNREQAAHLLDLISEADIPEPTGYNVLVLQYVQPDRKSGLIIPDRTKMEDELLGSVGLVLKLGPDAYKDQTKFPLGPWVKEGDWVAWARLKSAASSYQLKGLKSGTHVKLAFLADDAFVAVGINPERMGA